MTTESEMAEELIKQREWLERIRQLLHLKVADGRMVSWAGEPYAAETLEDAIAQEVIRSHELVRIRQRVFASKLSDQAKWQLYTLLNLVSEFCVLLAEQGMSARLMDVSEKIRDNLGSYFPEYSDEQNREEP